MDVRFPATTAGAAGAATGGQSAAGAGAGVGGASGASGSTGVTGVTGASGASGASGAAGAGVMGGMGEPCERGSSAPCTCSDGTSEGEKSCQFDASSPTMGSFGACKKCPPPLAAGSGGTGAGGAGGSAGGSGAAGSGDAGSGDAGSGGSIATVMCDPSKCPAATPPDMACCNFLEACGTTALLGICL